ncbi:MAG: class I SAM-dependent methyltransferase [Methanoregula sp.]|uniref:class I SAM-dependent methyltransferase n=1 Tax=Methanoregula sp. TaxID=2052170 RepID=UPI003BB0D0D5
MMEIKVTSDVEHFNHWSKSYDESWMQHLYFDRIHKRVLNLVDAGYTPATIVDVGCGTGRLLRKARERWPHASLTGIDPAEGMVKKARILMPDTVFIVSPAESIPLPDASVDLVFSTTSFHHWQDQAQGIREIRRILRPGGRFILSDMMVPRFLVKFIHHGTFKNPEEVHEIFEQAGLDVVTQRRSFLGRSFVTVGIRK